MSNEFVREERYIVFKMSDLGNSLKGDEIRRLAREYAEHLEQLVKKPLDYVVVGAGRSEYGPAWRAIEVRVTGAQPAPSVPDDVMRDARRYIWLRNNALDWYVGPEYSTYNDVVCSGECCNFAGTGIATAPRLRMGHLAYAPDLCGS